MSVDQSAAFDELVRRVRDQLIKPGAESDARAAEAAAALPQQQYPAGQQLRPVQRSGVFRRVSGPVPVPSVQQPEQQQQFEQQPDQSQPQQQEQEQDQQFAGAPQPKILGREELRIDVDGLAPTMTVSGTRWHLIQGTCNWIARVTKQPDGTYTGPIGYKDGNAALVPHAAVTVKIGTIIPWAPPASANVKFTGGAAPVLCVYAYSRAHFREVGIEFDTVSDASAVTAYALQSHPNRPADLPNITLTIEQAFSRLGIRTKQTAGADKIDVGEAGPDVHWSNLEMHDAMQKHWSKQKNVAQWQVWTLFAGQHEMGSGLGGIMFDTFGPNERQGCSIFSNSFISQPPPAGDPNPAAFVQRMRFWTAVHEIGHTFNLAHSWQKELGTGWIPQTNRPLSRSFMNYPYNVPGSTQAFFSDFRYLFDEGELLFLRHAPERFVQQGNIAWFDHHAFEQERRQQDGRLELSVRIRRTPDRRGEFRYQLLEPVIAELRLRNTSEAPVIVDRNELESGGVGVLLACEGQETKQWQPYLSYCREPKPTVLQPGESLYAPVQLSTGQGIGRIDEPGCYRIYASLQTESAQQDGYVLAEPVTVRVERPISRTHERLADEVLTDEVRRVLAFGGSRVLDQATDVLREAAEQLPEQPIAKHAAAALARTSAIPGRVLDEDAGKRQLRLVHADTRQAQRQIDTAYGDMDAAAKTFGHIRLAQNVMRLNASLSEQGETKRGGELVTKLSRTLREHGVPEKVVDEIKDSKRGYSGVVPASPRSETRTASTGKPGPSKGVPRSRKS